MIGAFTLEGDEIGRMLRKLGRPGTCGASEKVFMGAKGNITREAGLMGER